MFFEQREGGGVMGPMNVSKLRGGAWATVLATMAVGCASPTETHAPSAHRPSTNGAAERGRTSSVTPSLRLPTLQPRAAVTDGIEGRVVPSSVETRGGSEAQQWNAFDGEPSTFVESDNGRVELDVEHRSPGIDALRLRGPLRASVTLLDAAATEPSAIAGVDRVAVDVAEGAWLTLPLVARSAARTLRLKVEASDAFRLSEVELWGRVSAAEVRPAQRLAEATSRNDPGFVVATSSKPQGRVSAVDEAQARDAGTFSVFVPFADACRRAFLRYSLEGAAHWTSVARSINGSDESAPSAPSRVSQGGVQVEEIAASLLRRGENEVRFVPVRELGPSGYVVRDLSIVCAADARFDRSDDERVDSALFDGQASTGVLSSNRTASLPIVWDFGRPMQAHVFAFDLAEGTRGAIELAAEGTSRSTSIDLRGRRPGWNELRLPDDWPVGALRVRVSLARESAGGISEARVFGSPVDVAAPTVVVTWPHHGECRDGTMNVRGYVRNHGGSPWRVRVHGRETTTNTHGEWAIDVPIDASDSTSELAVVARHQAQEATAYVRVARCVASTPTVQTVSNDANAPFAEWVQPDRATTVTAGDLRIEVPRGAVSQPTRITVRPLANEQVARLDPGMTNVTRGARAYRLGPHPMRFLAALKLTVPVDPSLIPQGKSRHDATIYYYDEAARQWRALQGDEARDGDFAAGRTDHFTDFIAAVGSDAEGAQGSAGDRNSLGGLGAGAPLAGLDVIPAPVANAQGTATTGLTLRLPPGRQGMAPVLRAAYDSSSGNGLLGVGWSMPVSSISIDTRWGVPKYRGIEDHYQLDGQPIVHVATISEWVDEYQPRVQGPPIRIRRIRSGMSIRWEVTDANGVTSTFGGAAATLCAGSGTVTPTFPEPTPTPLAQCGVWALKESIDRYGNFVEYQYQIDGGTLPAPSGGSGAPWTQLYLLSVAYTGHRAPGAPPDVAPYYTVDFEWENRNDVQLSARLGFLTRTARRLTLAKVRTPTEEIRRYRFAYTYSTFDQSLLTHIRLFGSDGATQLYEYAFEYEAGTRGFSNTRQWNAGRPGFPMDSGFGNSAGAGAWFGIGDPALLLSIGAGVGGGAGGSHTSSVTADVNGDGLPDFLHRDGSLRTNSFYRATPTSPPDTTRGVLRSDHALADVGNDFFDQHTDSLNVRVGVAGTAGRGVVGVAIGRSWNDDSRILEDVDADGRVDLIQGPIDLSGTQLLAVRRNPFAGDRVHFGQFVGGSAVHDYTLGGLRPYSRDTTVTGPELEHLRALSYNTNPLVRWKATNRARVRIEGAITLPTTIGNGVQASIVHATATGETVLWEHEIAPGAAPCVPNRDGSTFKCSGPGLEIPDVLNSDRLYFRVNSLANIDGDEVFWSPVIRELDRFACVPVQDLEQPPCDGAAPLALFARAEDFRLADRDTVAFSASLAGRVRVSGTFTTTVPVRLRTFRKRLVPPPGVAWPVFVPGTTDPIAFVDAMVAAGADPQVLVMRSPSEVDDNGTLFGPGTHTIEAREFDVEERDQVIVHAMVDANADPGAISALQIAVNQVRVRPALGGPVFDVAATCVPRGPSSSFPGAPASAETRQCELLLAPPGTIRPAESVLRITNAEVAIAALPPTAFPTSRRRDDPLFGWYRGWSVGEWNESVAFSEVGLSQPFGSETAATLVRLAASGSPLPAPKSGPMFPRRAGDAFTVNGVVIADKTGTPLLRGVGIDSFVTASSMKPSARSAWRVDGSNTLRRSTNAGATSTNAPVMRAGWSRSELPFAQIPPPVTGDWGTTEAVVDFRDINGDGFPDSIVWDGSKGHVQLQVPPLHSGDNGSFAAPIPIQLPGRASLRSTSAANINAALGLPGSQGGEPNLGTSTMGEVYNQLLSNISAGYSTGGLNTYVDMIDLNGDGLPDQVRSIQRTPLEPLQYEVAYNLGYAFSQPVVIGLSDTLYPYMGTYGTAGGVQMRHNCSTNIGFGAYGVGLGPSFAVSRTQVATVDITGDGLPDRVFYANAVVEGARVWKVQVNRGSDFGPIIDWTVPRWSMNPTPPPPDFFSSSCHDGAFGGMHDYDAIAARHTWTMGFNAGFPLGISLLFLGLRIEPTYLNYVHEWGNSSTGLLDIDGDGDLDHVIDNEDTTLGMAAQGFWMRTNPNSRTNLLTSIHGPTGTTITLTYGREGNHVTSAGSSVQREMPTNRFVLSTITVSDPLSQSYTSTVSYFESGNYHRVEREFLGFNRVRVTRPDNSYTDTWYHNQDYYRRFTAYEQRSYSSAKNLLARTVDTFAVPPSALPPRTGVFFPARTRTDAFEYDGTSPDIAAARMQTGSSFVYNVHRLLERRLDERENGSADDLRTEIEYHVDPSLHFYAPNKVELFDVSNNLLRRETTEFNTNGSVYRVEQQLVGGTNPDTNTPWTGAAGTNPWVQFYYDTFGNVMYTFDPSNYYRVTWYDGWTHTYPSVTYDIFGYSTQQTWDLRYGSPLVSTDENLNQREIRYDVFGRVQQVFGVYEFGGPTPSVTYEYTLGTAGHTGPHRSITRTKDPANAGNTLDSIVFVDGLGRTIQRKVKLAIDYGPGATLMGHAVSGPFVRDSLGRITRQYQSFFEQMVPFDVMITAPPAHNETWVHYDPFGRVDEVHAANGTDTLTFSHSYSAPGSTPIRRITEASFARVGSPADARLTHAERDMGGNLRRLVQQNTVSGVLTDVITTYDYDLLGRLTAVHDASGNSTTAQYDSLDRMISLTDPDAGMVTYEYNLAGDLGARVTPELRHAGQKIFYDYEFGRMWRIRYPTTAATTILFGQPGAMYNCVGRAYRVIDSSGTRDFQYTPNGEVSFESRTLLPFGGLTTPTTAQMAFEYDSLGRAKSITYPSLDGLPAETVRYSYDLAGNLSGVRGYRGTTERSYIDAISYDQFGRRKRVTFGNGPTGNRVSTVYQYDDVEQRLTGIDTTTPFGQIQKLRYQYTAHGLVSQITNAVATGSTQGPTTATFEYDRLEQLVSANGLFTHEDGSERRFSLEMSYDVSGRTLRMNQQDELLLGGTSTPVAQTTRDALYTYAAGRRHRAETIGTSTFTYDRNGNQLQDDRGGGIPRHFEWDEEDRLRTVRDGAKVTAEFLYDSGGTRTHKTSPSNTTVYPSAFITVRNGTEVTRHIYAAGQRVSSVFSDAAGERVYWSHGDAQGSAHYTTRSDGKVHEHAEHLPFGEGWVQQSSGMDVGSHRFHGHELDGETGLHYVGARYYDPRTTRWLSTDPALPEYVLGGGVSDPRNLMTYGYVFNSPGNYVDPTGRMTVPDTAKHLAWTWEEFQRNCAGSASGIGALLSTLAAGSGGGMQVAAWASAAAVVGGQIVAGLTALAATYGAAMSVAYAVEHTGDDTSAMSSADQGGVATDATADREQPPTTPVRPPSPEGPQRPIWVDATSLVMAGLTAAGPVVYRSSPSGASNRPLPGQVNPLQRPIVIPPPSPQLFANLFPEDQPRHVNRARLQQEADGRWSYSSSDGTRRLPQGPYTVVRDSDGVLWGVHQPVGNPPRGHRRTTFDRVAGHVDVARGEPVQFAGEMVFGGRGARGVLRLWTNGSGHYQVPVVAASQSGLPMSLFRDFRELFR